MIILIRYFDGRLQGAILLSITGDAMRVAIPGLGDATEFTLHKGQWFSDGGDPVEIEFNAAEAEDPTCTVQRGIGVDRLCVYASGSAAMA